MSRLSLWAAVLWVSLGVVAVALYWRISTRPFAWTETWGCGYTAPTPRMQYTASSFAQLLVGLFDWALRPTFHRPKLEELFPAKAEFSSHVPEVVLDRAVLPVAGFLGRILFWFRLMQQGAVQIYLLYIFAILVLLLFFGR